MKHGCELGRLPAIYSSQSGDHLAAEAAEASMSASSLIAKAERIARGLRAMTAGERSARHSLYVVLLHDPRTPERWGLYVGQTARDPDWRFD